MPGQRGVLGGIALKADGEAADGARGPRLAQLGVPVGRRVPELALIIDKSLDFAVIIDGRLEGVGAVGQRGDGLHIPAALRVLFDLERGELGVPLRPFAADPGIVLLLGGGHGGAATGALGHHVALYAQIPGVQLVAGDAGVVARAHGRLAVLRGIEARHEGVPVKAGVVEHGDVLILAFKHPAQIALGVVNPDVVAALFDPAVHFRANVSLRQRGEAAQQRQGQNQRNKLLHGKTSLQNCLVVRRRCHSSSQ